MSALAEVLPSASGKMLVEYRRWRLKKVIVTPGPWKLAGRAGRERAKRLCCLQLGPECNTTQQQHVIVTTLSSHTQR